MNAHTFLGQVCARLYLFVERERKRVIEGTREDKKRMGEYGRYNM